MARGDFYVFNEFLVDVGSEKHNLPSDTLKIGIIDATATPLVTQTTPTWSDFSANEVATGTAYVAGGPSLTGVTWTQTAGVTKLDSNSITIAYDAAGFTDGAFGIVYNSSAPSSEAIGFLDLGGPVGNDTEPLIINPPAAGWMTYARKVA
jgi:hypothetical protein